MSAVSTCVACRVVVMLYVVLVMYSSMYVRSKCMSISMQSQNMQSSMVKYMSPVFLPPVVYVPVCDSRYVVVIVIGLHLVMLWDMSMNVLVML